MMTSQTSLNKKLVRFVIIATIMCLLLFSTMPFGVVLGINVSPGDWVEYAVTDSSETENMFYGAWPPGTFYGNWTVSEGDEIWFNVTGVSSTDINGTLKLGSYTFSNVRNIDVASALALSIYPWLGGFFADVSNWNKISNDISGTNTTLTYNVSYVQVINGKETVFSVNVFNTTNYYGQFSLFYYDSNTGLLLAGFTSFGSYRLGLKLLATSLFIEEITTQATLPNVIFLLMTLVPIVLFRTKRKNS